MMMTYKKALTTLGIAAFLLLASFILLLRYVTPVANTVIKSGWELYNISAEIRDINQTAARNGGRWTSDMTSRVVELNKIRDEEFYNSPDELVQTYSTQDTWLKGILMVVALAFYVILVAMPISSFFLLLSMWEIRKRRKKYLQMRKLRRYR